MIADAEADRAGYAAWPNPGTAADLIEPVLSSARPLGHPVASRNHFATRPLPNPPHITTTPFAARDASRSPPTRTHGRARASSERRARPQRPKILVPSPSYQHEPKSSYTPHGYSESPPPFLRPRDPPLVGPPTMAPSNGSGSYTMTNNVSASTLNPASTFQHIQDMAAKRVSTLDYLRKT